MQRNRTWEEIYMKHIWASKGARRQIMASDTQIQSMNAVTMGIS